MRPPVPILHRVFKNGETPISAAQTSRGPKPPGLSHAPHTTARQPALSGPRVFLTRSRTHPHSLLVSQKSRGRGGSVQQPPAACGSHPNPRAPSPPFVENPVAEAGSSRSRQSAHPQGRKLRVQRGRPNRQRHLREDPGLNTG